MTDYTWAFDKSFLVFLLIAFVSTALAESVRSLIPMPLIYGAIFLVGFGTGILPTDMLLSANMIAVGTIAYNVLVVHSGTMINLPLLRSRWREVLLCVAGLVLMTAAELLLLTPILGKGMALLAPGSVLGGGASCAVASRWVSESHPELSVFPWLIFMLQGLFSVPAVTWALKKEGLRLLEEYRAAGAGGAEQGTFASGTGRSVSDGTEREGRSLCGRIPDRYKTTPYYLGGIMIAAVVNGLLHDTVLSGLPINPYITALLLGLLLGNLGLLDRSPLFRSDSYGLLILGLMGLMANTLAHTPWQAAVSYVPALLLVFLLSTGILLSWAVLGGRILKISPWRASALLMNCMMGYPVNGMLLEQTAALGETAAEKGMLKKELGPVLGMGTSLISNGLSILAVGVLVLFV